MMARCACMALPRHSSSGKRQRTRRPGCRTMDCPSSSLTCFIPNRNALRACCYRWALIARWLCTRRQGNAAPAWWPTSTRRRGRANCKTGGQSSAPAFANSLEGISHRRHFGWRQLVGQCLLFQLRHHVGQQLLQLLGQGQARLVQGQVDVAADADAVDAVFDAQAADLQHVAFIGVGDEFLCAHGISSQGDVFWDLLLILGKFSMRSFCCRVSDGNRSMPILSSSCAMLITSYALVSTFSMK